MIRAQLNIVDPIVPVTAMASTGAGPLVRWWQRVAANARRRAERRELLALDAGSWRDLGAGRADEEAHKPHWCP